MGKAIGIPVRLAAGMGKIPGGNKRLTWLVSAPRLALPWSNLRFWFCRAECRGGQVGRAAHGGR